MVDIYGDFDEQYARLLRSDTRFERLDPELVYWMFRQYSLGVDAIRFVIKAGKPQDDSQQDGSFWTDISQNPNAPQWRVRGYTLFMYQCGHNCSRIDWYKVGSVNMIATRHVPRFPLRLSPQGLRSVWYMAESRSHYWEPTFTGADSA